MKSKKTQKKSFKKSIKIKPIKKTVKKKTLKNKPIKKIIKKKTIKTKNVIGQIEEKLKNIDDRLKALEKEQRLIREDILSGVPTERMRQRLFDNTEKRKEELKKKIENEISFEI